MPFTESLLFYGALLVVLFIIIITLIVVSFKRSGRGRSGQEVMSRAPRKPDPDERNPDTRRDSAGAM